MGRRARARPRRGAARESAAGASRRSRSARSSTASCACDADGRAAPPRPDLDGPPRRRGVRARPPSGSTRPRCAPPRGCNLDPGHVGREDRLAAGATSPRRHAPRAHFLLPGLVRRAARRAASSPSTPRTPPRRCSTTSRGGGWEPAACDGVRGRRRRGSRRSGRRTPCSATVAPWLREAAGLGRDTLVVLGCGDEMAATLGAGVVDEGAICDVLGTAEPVCAVSERPLHDPTGVTELHPHALPGRLARREPRLALRRRVPLVPRPRRRPRARPRRGDGRGRLRAPERARRVGAAPGADGLLWLPRADRRDDAGVERRRARLLVRPDGGARARPPPAGAARGQRATRSATSSRPCAARASRPREIVCVAGGARGALIAAAPRRRHRPAGEPPPPTSRRRPAAPRCWPRPVPGSTAASRDAAVAMVGAARRPRRARPGDARAVYDDALRTATARSTRR